jgi:ankyrin repeat protein
VASSCGNLNALNQLLQAGAEVDLESEIHTKEMTAMHYAAERGHLELVKALLNAGASPFAKSRSGKTPFWRAARSGSVEVMELLKPAGSDINHYTWNAWRPLHEALRCGRTDAVSKLLEWGADESFPGFDYAQPSWDKSRQDFERQRPMMEKVLADSRVRMAKSGGLLDQCVTAAWASIAKGEAGESQQKE